MRFRGVCYRGHDPQWAFSPLSGAGAALKGGRFNPAGTPALYLGLSIEGVIAEMGHGLSRRFDPLTLCAYDVDCDDVVDLRTARGRKAVSVDDADVACAWSWEMAHGREPASWQVSRRLIAADIAGIIAPSSARAARPRMANLVLWKWGAERPHRAAVFDPQERLPKDRRSWT